MQNFVVTTGKNLIDRDLNRSFSRVSNLSTNSRTVHLPPICYVFACAIDTSNQLTVSLFFFFNTAFSSLGERKTCSRGGLKILRLRTSTHLQIDMPSVVRMSPVKTRHARKDRRHDHTITIMVTCRYQLHSRQKTPALIYSRFDSRNFFTRYATTRSCKNFRTLLFDRYD